VRQIPQKRLKDKKKGFWRVQRGGPKEASNRFVKKLGKLSYRTGMRGGTERMGLKPKISRYEKLSKETQERGNHEHSKTSQELGRGGHISQIKGLKLVLGPFCSCAKNLGVEGNYLPKRSKENQGLEVGEGLWRNV